jgi:hypothetical protein
MQEVNSEMNCPANKKECPCKEYSKENLCDYPYRTGMTLEEIKELRIEEK